MSIKEYFKKEILFAFAMVLIFRATSEDYRAIFMGPQIYIAEEVSDAGETSLVITEGNSMYDFTNYTP